MTGVRVATSTTPMPAPGRVLREHGSSCHARALARAMQRAQTWDELRAAADAVSDFPTTAWRLGRLDLRRHLDEVLCAQALRLWSDGATAEFHAAADAA